MTKLLEQALRQVERLSPSEQDPAGAALIDYLAQRRRRADPDRKLVSHADAKERLSRLGG